MNLTNRTKLTFLSVAIATLSGLANAQTVYSNYNIQLPINSTVNECPSGAAICNGAGTPVSLNASFSPAIDQYNPKGNVLKFSISFRKDNGSLPNILTFVIASTETPGSGGIGKYAYLVLDATDAANPELSAYAFNGGKGAASWAEGAPGKPADTIISTLSDPTWKTGVQISNWSEKGKDFVKFEIELDASPIQKHAPKYAPSGSTWNGTGFGPDKFFIYLNPLTANSISYSTSGFITALDLSACGELELSEKAISHVCKFDCENQPWSEGSTPAQCAPTPTPTPSATCTPKVTPTPTKTATPTRTVTPTATATKTVTPSVTPTKTATPSKTATPANTPTFTATPVATKTSTPLPTATPELTVTAEPTATATPVPSASATATPEPTLAPEQPVVSFGCEDRNNSSVLATMDSLSVELFKISKTAARALQKADRRRETTKFAKKSLNAAASLKVEAWTATWSLPAVTVQCLSANSDRCNVTDLSPLIVNYTKKITELNANAQSLLRKLRKLNPIATRKLSAKLANKYNEALKSSSSVPLTTVECK